MCLYQEFVRMYSSSSYKNLLLATMNYHLKHCLFKIAAATRVAAEEDKQVMHLLFNDTACTYYTIGIFP